MSAAAEPGSGGDAVVELFGKLPPVLIIHGDKDQVVPITEPHKLRDLLTARRLTLFGARLQGRASPQTPASLTSS